MGGGFAVVETDNPDSRGDAPAKFVPCLEFEIIPVGEIAETVRASARAWSSHLGLNPRPPRATRGPLLLQASGGNDDLGGHPQSGLKAAGENRGAQATTTGRPAAST